jgi:nitroreductase
MAEQPDLAFGVDAPLHAVMSTMRAMRRLKPDPVPREVLEQLVEAATWAPSGGNQQQYSWVVVTDRAKMAELAKLWEQCHDYYVSIMADAPAEMLDERRRERLLGALRFQRDHFAETPAVIVACYDLSGLRSHLMHNAKTLAQQAAGLGARRVAMLATTAKRSGDMSEAASVYPGVQNLLLTARALGLAATLTTWHLFFEPEFKKTLGIPRGVKTFALIPIGYPRGNFGPVRRRPAADAIHWEGW